MFELHIADTELTGATVAVSWCVDKELLTQLNELKIKDPVVVLIVAPTGKAYHKSKQSRIAVPLKDLMAYVDFYVPGQNKIWGFISDNDDRGISYYMSTYSEGWVNSVLNYSGDGWALDGSGYREAPKFAADTLTVEVPADCFAPEPSDFEKMWVNWLFTNKAVDQCNFRRRRMWAYTVQFPLLVLNIILKSLFTAVAALYGARALSLKLVLHPIIYGLGDVVDLFKEGTVFLGRGKSQFWNWATLPLMPLLVILSRILLLGHKFHSPLSLGGSVLLVSSLIALAIFVLSKWAESRRKALPWYMADERQANMLYCSEDKKPIKSVNDLPQDKRSFRLKFRDLKSKVCRPFSR